MSADDAPNGTLDAQNVDGVAVDVDGEPVNTPVSKVEFADAMDDLVAEEPTDEDIPVTPGEFAAVVGEMVTEEPAGDDVEVTPGEFAKVVDEAGDEFADEDPAPTPANDTSPSPEAGA